MYLTVKAGNIHQVGIRHHLAGQGSAQIGLPLQATVSRIECIGRFIQRSDIEGSIFVGGLPPNAMACFKDPFLLPGSRIQRQ